MKSIRRIILVLAFLVPVGLQADCPYTNCCFDCSSDGYGFSVCTVSDSGWWYNCHNGSAVCNNGICSPYCGDSHCFMV